VTAGAGNHYTGFHPYFFIAAYLDPRNKKALKKMMVPDQASDRQILYLIK